jgi:hypothetical protein
VKRVAHARILEYAREMGIDKALTVRFSAVGDTSDRCGFVMRNPPCPNFSVQIVVRLCPLLSISRE